MQRRRAAAVGPYEHYEETASRTRRHALHRDATYAIAAAACLDTPLVAAARMVGAVPPFISGAISKTVKLPHEADVDDIADATHKPGDSAPRHWPSTAAARKPRRRCAPTPSSA